MNYLGTPILYDPAGAVTKAINALQAMTAFDTTNLRLAITVPAHGMVGFRIRCALEGANNNESTILLGVMVGASVKGRVLAFRGWPGVNGTAGANFSTVLDVDIIITGLATGATNFDAAYGIENVGAASPNGIKYGGPDNTTISDAWGGFYFAAYDPQPLKVGLDGGVNPTQWNGTNVASPATAGIPEVNVKNVNNVAAATPGASGGLIINGSNSGAITFNNGMTITSGLTDGLTISTTASGKDGMHISGATNGHAINAIGGTGGDGFHGVGGAAGSSTAAGQGFSGTGGAANTTSGGTAGRGFLSTGGAGAATTNGSGEGFTVAAGGTTTVSGANAVSFTGTGAFHGLLSTSGSGATGDGIKAVAASTNGNGLNLAGLGTGQGILSTAGATGNALKLVGGATSGHGLLVNTTSGDGFNLSPTAGHGINIAANGTSKHGIFSTGGTAGTSDGIKAAAGTGGVDLRANITGNLTGTVSTVTTVTNQLTAAQVATGVWQDATSGDFTVSSSIGKSLYTTGNAPGAASGLALVGSNMGTATSVSGSVGSVTSGVTVTTNNDKTGYSLTVTPPTAATIATTIWQDLTSSSDFTTVGSIGKLLVTDIDATISSRGTGTGTALTSAQVATAVWTDTTASDFTTALSIGKSVMNGVTLGTGLTINAYTGDTPQTGDSYAIVNSGTFGNAKLVRSTTPANTLDISATGEAGVDWANVGGQSTSVNLSATTVNLTNTLTTYTGNTPQTGDSFARIGATGSGLTSLAPSATALSTAQWSNTLATNLGTLASHDPGTTIGTSTLTQTQVTGGAYDIQSASCVLGDARIAHLNADITSRMASYTQPTGFLAATFPATVSSFDPTTDVVAHVTLVDTTTDVTNAVTIGDVILAASQPNYAPAIAGDAMTLTAAYDAAKTAAQASTALSTAQWTNGRAANLDNLNATVSSRLAASSYTAPDNAGIAAIEGKTNNLPTDPASTTDVINAVAAIESHGDGAWLTATGFSTPSDVSAVPGAVWDVTLASHLTPGSTGFALNAAGSAGDPWATSLPGAYAAGEAGYIVGNNLNAAITSRSTFDPASDTVAHVTLTDTATTLTNKTGFGLAANGLDTISVADPGAPANWTTLPKMLIALVRRVAKGKVVKDATAGEIRTYADNGTTVNATQAFTVTASTETLEEAT